MKRDYIADFEEIVDGLRNIGEITSISETTFISTIISENSLEVGEWVAIDNPNDIDYVVKSATSTQFTVEGIGITGIIGSGKSVVSSIFQILGIPVYNADYRAKLLMNNSNKIKNQIISNFGKESYVDNTINVKYIAGQIFKNEIKRQLINSIVHPAVLENFISWSDNQDSNCCAIESALIYEAGFEKVLDHIIMVKCPKDLLIKRITLRDKINISDAKNRINSQKFSINSLLKPDFVVHNNEEESLILQCIDIYKKITQ
jgi:dephospho-CoA kinase